MKTTRYFFISFVFYLPLEPIPHFGTLTVSAKNGRFFSREDLVKKVKAQYYRELQEITLLNILELNENDFKDFSLNE